MSVGIWFRPRTLWLPTWRTCLVLLFSLAVGGAWVGSHLHGWLAISEPVEDAKYVVVEGWVPDSVVRAAYDWSNQHGVKLIFTTGIPLDQGQYLGSYPTYAEICAETLKKLGQDPAKIRAAPAVQVKTERTRAMALGLKQVLDAESIPAGERKINLFTNGTHAFRSHMHFQRVLGKDWQVGVISVPAYGYPASSWWRYSQGVKNVMEELVGIASQCLGS